MCVKKSVFDVFLVWENLRTATPKSALGKAFYLSEEVAVSKIFLKDGRLKRISNYAERNIKPFEIGKKNIRVANMPGRATGNTVIFSLIQTAMENKLDPYRCLTCCPRKQTTQT